ncbi:hypothetical protein ACN28E_24230 [Archangium lansingense]|uniref:hypothetical protein n=1 Tax=Archangium lansingense TaxID=2995310 RepID=UPI003B7E722D
MQVFLEERLQKSMGLLVVETGLPNDRTGMQTAPAFRTNQTARRFLARLLKRGDGSASEVHF